MVSRVSATFQQDFLDEMNRQVNEMGESTHTYIVRGHENEHNWAGIDLTKVRLTANSFQQAWLQLRNHFLENRARGYKGVPYDMYDEWLISFIIREEFDEDEQITMKQVVDAVMEHIQENDTLWIEKL